MRSRVAEERARAQVLSNYLPDHFKLIKISQVLEFANEQHAPMPYMMFSS